jgi:hypothetical protein
MKPIQQLEAENIDVSRFEYEDSVVLAADFGYVDSSSVDVVGDTVIVVADGEQFDIELDGDARAFMKNGILTIEVDA